MGNHLLKTIYKKIKKYDRIVIARHVGADPDALASSIGLKHIIEATFPEKEVYVVGYPASKFKYLGMLDKWQPELAKHALLIVTDTPDAKRIDGADPEAFSYVIKIDHHPFIEKFGDLEWVDATASSASQMIMEMAFGTKLKMTKEAAEKLYIGLVADTDRFLFSYTSPKTFYLVSQLISETNIDFTKLYDNLYLRPWKEAKFEGYILSHLKITENGFAYANITNKVLEEYDVDAATAGNMVNRFNYIDEIYAWAIFSEDKNNGNIRGSIRSRGPIINEVATHFNGGGHIYASGVRVDSFDEVKELVAELDEACKEYREKITY